MSQTIAIVGAGILGRLLAFRLSDKGYQVTLVDQDNEEAKRSCSYAAAGMLAPYVELESSEPVVTELGKKSLELLPIYLKTLEEPVFFQREGTLVVSHALDQKDMARLKQKVLSHYPDVFEEIGADKISELEPELSGRFQSAIFCNTEGQIDVRGFLEALKQTLRKRSVRWILDTPIHHVLAHRIENRVDQFDWVLDCRGLGASSDVKDLRGVRGELLYIHAPDVRLNRPVRLFHPRYPVYVVPKPNQRYVIGATSIETDSLKPMTVQSALELLSAAFSIHPGFSEATIEEMVVGCRPAFSDNLPKVWVEPGLIRINGLYRHGYLIAPAMTEYVVSLIEGGEHANHFEWQAPRVA